VPNPLAHIEFAQRTAQCLGSPILESNLGYFLLGSTSPDIRVITRRHREVYHFAPLDFDEVGAGIDGMFGSHPKLRQVEAYDGPTQAFVAGYMTHLVADETWITSMYRPYFGNRDVFEDDAVGNVMDRALQLELDRQAWETASAHRPIIEAASNRVQVDFIPRETLDEWRLWVLRALDSGFSWERLRFMAGRISRGDESHPAHALADDFVRCAPSGLASLYGYVPQESLDEYRERSVDALVKAIEEYLP
jgi:hypothetical protein